MLSKYTILVFLPVLLLAGCKDNEREKQLADREQAVTEREKVFALKEADYQSLLRMRDSLSAVKDTVIVAAWPESVAGTWSARLVCKESSCTEYVVGDVRSDSWEFASDSTGTFTRVLNREKLLRIYQGSLSGETVQLHFATDSTAQKKVDMNVTVNAAGADAMKGEQTVTIDDNCKARFSVELTRSKTR